MPVGPTRTIGELAERYGIAVRTIRLYEKRGLIAPRRPGTRGLYGTRDETRLATVLRAKRMGFNLAEIGRLVEALEAVPSEIGVRKRKQLSHLLARQTAILLERRRELDFAIAELKAALARRDQPGPE